MKTFFPFVLPLKDFQQGRGFFVFFRIVPLLGSAGARQLYYT